MLNCLVSRNSGKGHRGFCGLFHTEVGEGVQRAFSNFKELLSEFYQICKDFFYDSYSGWKIKRIAIAAGSTLSVVALLITFIVVVPNGPLGKMVSDGLSDVADALLSEDVAESLKVILGRGEQGVIKYLIFKKGRPFRRI